MFAFYGVFNPKLWMERIDLHSSTITQDDHGLKYAFIKTKAKRASEIQSHLKRHDRDAPDAMKVKLTRIAGFENIISFKKGEDPTKHSVYKTIMKYSKSASSVKWERECIVSIDEEYDVVKKRRMMDAGNDDDQTCPDALQQFEEFESSVLPALLEMDKDDRQTRHNEMLQMEQDLCSGVKPVSGGVYVAMSNAVKYPKIGATRRAHPSGRLQELSRYVPSPFKAIFWVPSMLPFKTEADIHRHFNSLRIREKGACTEFFDVDIATVGEYLKANYHVQEKEAIASSI